MLRRNIGDAIVTLVISVFLIIGIVVMFNHKSSTKPDSPSIVATNFAGYDFARAVMGDSSEIKMLLKPGSEAHDYEPTPEDIIDIKNANLLIYNGGESEEWVEKMLSANEIDGNKTLKLMDLVELELETDGAEVEYDEHTWTNPVNAIILVQKIADRLSGIKPEKAETFQKNAASYINKLQEVDQTVREIVKNSSKKLLIFGDRFPFLYFVHEYGLDFAAAFAGCAEQTEASSQTIADLIEKAKENNIKTILKIELTSDKIAKTIAEEIDGKVLELSAAHNISNDDFENNVTYLDIMNRNLQVLKEALR